MQDLTVTLEKIAKMQDWIVTNVTDIFGLRHCAADQNQDEKFSF